ncbi:MAG: hypothetical protein AAFX04_10675 [Pseudomonadota bacterium]
MSLAALMMSVSAALGQQLGGGAAPDIPVLRVVLALVLCLIVAIGVILWLRRRHGHAGGKMPLAGFLRDSDAATGLNIVETRRLNAHYDSCVIRHNDREYLLLLGPQDAKILSDQPVCGSHDSDDTRIVDWPHVAG